MARKKAMKAILGLISPLFPAENGPNTPKIMYSCTGIKHTVLGGAFGGHSWVIMDILGLFGGPIAKFEQL